MGQTGHYLYMQTRQLVTIFSTALVSTALHGQSFEQSGASFYTISGVFQPFRASDSIPTTHGAGVSFSPLPWISPYIEFSFTPLTGAVLERIDRSGSLNPRISVNAYELDGGFQVSFLTRRRIQPHVSTGPGVFVYRIGGDFPENPVAWTTYGVGVGARIFIYHNLAIRPEFRIATYLRGPSGAYTRATVGVYYSFGKPQP